MNIALIARSDNTGLGNLSWDYARNLGVKKTLIIKRNGYSHFPDRFTGGRLSTKEISTPDEIDWLLDGIDVLLTIETPYNWDTYSIAKKKGVRTVLIPMYEWLPPRRTEYKYIDLFMCGSTLDYNVSPGNKVFIQIPVDRKRLPFKKRVVAKTFIHNAGHGGVLGRNGTSELLAAIKMVKSDVNFIIRSQFPIGKIQDDRVQVIEGNVEHYWDLWREGDIFVFPCKFGGNFLPMNEAMSVGMPIMTTDFSPWNKFLNKDLLIPTTRTISGIVSGRSIEMAVVAPKDIAEKIDQFAHKNIEKYSEELNQMAGEISWEKIKPRIIKEFEKLCAGK